MTFWTQTASGGAVDLKNPDAATIDFADIGEALGKMPRFAGATPGVVYSVAQHSVVGADTLFKATNNADLAAAFLLHDAHEAFMGDWIAPAVRAAAWHAAEIAAGIVADTRDVEAIFLGGIRRLKESLDVAIYDAAGLGWWLQSFKPEIQSQRTIVHRLDMALQRAERDAHMAPPPRAWPQAIENAEKLTLPGRALKPMAWPDAMAAFADRCRLYLPIHRRGEADLK